MGLVVGKQVIPHTTYQLLLREIISHISFAAELSLNKGNHVSCKFVSSLNKKKPYDFQNWLFYFQIND